MEYFTISPSGVVHVVPSALSDCLSLSQWVHQCMMCPSAQSTWGELKAISGYNAKRVALGKRTWGIHQLYHLYSQTS